MSRLCSTSLITKRDQQRSDVFAVLAAFGKRGARARAFEAIRRQVDAHGMRFRVAGTNDAARAHFADVDVFDNAASKVFESSQESARAKEAA